MKLKIIVLIVFISTNFFGQEKLPKNLKQAVKYLDKDCPDIVKNKIKNIHNDSLIYAVYPFAKSEQGKDYKTIFLWTIDENSNSRLIKSFENKGIFDFHSEVILFSFKQYLLQGEINEKNILNKYIEYQKKSEEKDKIKFVTDSIDNIYIPKNLEDSFTQINLFWSDSTKTKAKNLTEDKFSSNVHFGFGMWIRNNWKLWGGSRLSKYFNDLGIRHPDDMSGIILTSYHRYLNNKEIRLEEQIKHYQDFWENSRKSELQRQEVEFSKYKLGDTLEFKYSNGYVSKKQEEKDDNSICVAKGLISELNQENFLIKVKIIETCDNKGIIYFDNDGSKIYNLKTKRWTVPPKRIIKKVKKNKEQWFKYNDWETIE